MSFRVGIIGGGISGLACALKAQELMPEAEIHVLEAGQRFGGLIESSLKEGFVVELGADAFLNDREWMPGWLQKLGLDKKIIATTADKRRSFIYKNGKVVPLPQGFYLISPTSLGALLNANFISWPGKLRMAWEWFIPRRKEESDESVADFILRRFGREALVKVGQPMIGGIYTADPAHLSMRASLPKFHQMEQTYGSLIRAFSAQKKEAAEKQASGPRYRLFSSFQNGMEELIQALVSHLNQAVLRTDFPVLAVRKADGKWRVESANGQSIDFDVVCIAAPAPRAAAILKQEAPEISEQLEKISYESSVIVNLAYETKKLPSLPQGFGVVVPESEKRKIVGVTFSHQKFMGRAPEEKVLVRVFMGGAFHRDLYGRSDSELVALAEEELKIILKIEAKPVWTLLRRYPKAMPQYEVGHLERVESIFKNMEKYPGLFLTGNAYYGVGIPESIERAHAAAEKMAAFKKGGRKTAGFDHILLVGFGGPEKREDVWPFLLEVTKGAGVPEARLKNVEQHYEEVGGTSPYNACVRSLAEKIKKQNREKNISLPVFLGMKNWRPFMKDTLSEIKKQNLKNGLAIVLAPHRSEASWDKYVRCVSEALKENGGGLFYEYLDAWHENPGYTGAQAQELRKVLDALTPEEKDGLHVIFCAHSIPVEMAERSQYAQEFQKSSEIIARELGLVSWETAYQSRSGNPRQPWLEPDVNKSIAQAKTQGKSGVMIVPVGFWCDNVEVLFDLDIEAAKEAAAHGLKFWRVPTVADNPEFAEMFSRLIEKRLRNA